MFMFSKLIIFKPVNDKTVNKSGREGEREGGEVSSGSGCFGRTRF